jgi:hypothetical protein
VNEMRGLNLMPNNSQQDGSETRTPTPRKKKWRLKLRWAVTIFIFASVLIAHQAGGIDWVMERTITRWFFYHYEPWDMKNVLDTVSIGDEIVVALEQYKQDFGQYPTSLEVLVPDYLRRVRNPRAGFTKWHYRWWRDDNNLIYFYYFDTSAITLDGSYSGLVSYRLKSGQWLMSRRDDSKDIYIRSIPVPRP